MDAIQNHSWTGCAARVFDGVRWQGSGCAVVYIASKFNFFRVAVGTTGCIDAHADCIRGVLASAGVTRANLEIFQMGVFSSTVGGLRTAPRDAHIVSE